MAGPAAGIHDEQTSRRRFLQLGGIAGGLAPAGPLLVVAPDAVAATRDRPAGEASVGSAAPVAGRRDRGDHPG
jgi:hypothetical protein